MMADFFASCQFRAKATCRLSQVVYISEHGDDTDEHSLPAITREPLRHAYEIVMYESEYVGIVFLCGTPPGATKVCHFKI